MKPTVLIRVVLALHILLAHPFYAAAQIIITPGGSGLANPPAGLVANTLLGQGVTLVGTPVFSGVNAGIAKFDATVATNLGLLSGVILTTGNNTYAAGPNNNGGDDTPYNGDNGSTITDGNLSTLAGGSTIRNCAKLDFDFIPLSDTLRFRYVFASEEYREFVCSGFNDVFGFFVTGARPTALGGGTYTNFNIATLPGTNTPITIDNINNGGTGFGSTCFAPGVNPQFYRDNPQGSGTINTQFDGLTTVLTAKIVVVPCTQYRIKLAIGDVGDAIFDSAVFLEASSFGTGAVNTSVVTAQPDNTISEFGTPGQVCFSIPRAVSTPTTVPVTYVGTAQIGVDYTATPNPLVIPAGQTSACVTLTPITDNLNEPTETIKMAVRSSTCQTDTFTLSLIDRRIIAPVFPTQTICTGQNVVLDATQAVITSPPNVTSNTTGGVISCACASGTPGPPFVSSINVSGVIGNFQTANSGMQVCLNINHTFDADLDISLISPCGEVLELSTDNGGSGDNYNNTCFSVAATTPITAGTAPFNGTYKPEGAWSVFNGCPYNGVWRLQVYDDGNPTNGTFVSWSMTIPAPYNLSYAWAPTAQATPTVSVAPTTNTTYTVTVSDSYGVSLTASAQVNVVTTLPPPTITCGATTNNSTTFNWTPVSGATNYSITINGGAPISVAGNINTYQVTGAAGSNQTIVVAPTASCPAQNNTQVCAIVNACNASVTAAATPIACFGGTSTITATAANTSGTVNYSITGVAPSTNNQFSKAAGTYLVSITDAGGCTATTNITVTEPTPLAAVPSSPGGVSCFGGNNGRGLVVPSGGTIPYNYLWDNGAITANPNNLIAGSHTVRVTDANGCSLIGTITVATPALLVATASLVDSVSCIGLSNGKATVTTTGGTGTISYLWDSNAATQIATNLNANIHVVTVTDANSCSTTATITMLEPNVVNAFTTFISQVKCFGGNTGSASVTGSGGNLLPNYTYNWDTPSTLQTAPNLNVTVANAGVHTVTVTDRKGCSATATVTMTQPTALAVTTTQDSVSCFGGADGKALANVTGGTSPYTYAWNGSAGSVPNPQGLTATTYTVTITDANLCSITNSIAVLQPTALTLTITPNTGVTCTGASNGSATANPIGGSPGFTYLWDNGETLKTAILLTATTHTVTVTDSNNCSKTATVTITTPTPITAPTMLIDSVSCKGLSDGKAKVTAAGGTGAFTYLWDDGSTTATVNIFNEGVHFVTVTDANFCSTVTNVLVPAPAVLLSTINIQRNVACFGGNDGRVLVASTGGNPNYTYVWSNAAFIGANPNNLPQGTHSVTVTDRKSCTATADVTISQPTQLTATATTTALDSVTCFGGNNGRAQANLSGGVPPYTYNWGGGITGSNPNNLTGGVQTVTVTDASNCTTTASVTILEPLQLVVTATAIDTTSCVGIADGKATATVVGGSTPYTYIWTGGIPGSSPTTLPAGTNTVVVTDAKGCVASSSAVILSPTPVTVSIAIAQQIACFQGNTGSLTATVTGGATPYTYLWDNGAQTSLATSFSAGTHTVNITDANGCNKSATLTLTQPTGITPRAVQNSPVRCFGDSNGTATASGTGGTLPYSFAWDNMVMTAANITLTGGLHCVTITDASNCSTNTCVTIIEPTVLQITATPVDSVSCFGTATGKASVSISGGIAPYQVLWDNGSVSTAPVNLTAGQHCVTVTDVNSCSTTACVFIETPLAISITPAVTTLVNCFGGNDGTASVTASGGRGTLSYTWNTSPLQFAANAVNLIATTYTVTVSDSRGCNSTVSATITQATEITLGIVADSAKCFNGGTGSATVTAVGGTGTYTYAWSTNPQQNGQSAVGLGAGVYTVTVTDANVAGCSKQISVRVEQPQELQLTTSGTNITCNGLTNGIVTVTSTGGSAPLSYNWNTTPPTPIRTATGLSAGVYTVTVTDSKLCSKTATAEVASPSPLVLTMSGSDAVCNGQANGTVTVGVQGGTLPTGVNYIYNWNTLPIPQATATALGVLAGTYTVTVTDGNTCVSSASITITEPSAVTAIASATPTKCFGDSNGTATATGAGGSAGFTYSWNSVPPQLTATATALPAGIYTCTVTDQVGCVETVQIEVTQPFAVTVSLDSTEVKCFGGTTGTIIASAGNGVGTFTYAWSGIAASQNTATVTNLTADIYTVTVTDANLCSVQNSIEVTSQSEIILSTKYINPKCFGFNNGRATVAASGGTGTYTYLWNTTPNQQIDTTAVGLIAGTYLVTVTDGNACTISASVTLGQPQQIAATLTFQNIKCKGGNDGAVTVSPTGGTAPYQFQWQHDTTIVTPTAGGLVAGFYSCRIKDAQGCITNINTQITEPSDRASVTAEATEARCFGSADGTAKAVALGGTITATASYQYVWSTNPAKFGTPIGGLAAGDYTVTATDINGCTATASTRVLQPSTISIQPSTTTPPSCHDGRDGTGTVAAAGGTPGYLYTWNTIPAQTGVLANGLAGGQTYTVTATDILGCTASGTITIGNPEPITLVTSSTAATCFGNASGTVKVVANGGTPTYNYTWTGGNIITPATTDLVTALTAGVYNVTVSDTKGCSATAKSIVVQGSTLNVRASSTDVLCAGQTNGTGTVLVTGGAPVYTYLWSNLAASNTTTVTDLAAGTYSVTVSDANGCSSVTAVTIAEPQPLTLGVTQLAISCYGGADGRVTLTGNGGKIPYKYSYNGGATFTGNNALIGTKSGTYTVAVRDANGCTASATAFVDEPAQLLVDAGEDRTIEFDDVTTLTAVPSTNAGILTYLWTATPTDPSVLPDASSAVITAVPAQDTYYEIVVTNANGCKASDKVFVRVNATRRVFIATGFTPNTDKTNDVLLVQGGRGTKKVNYFRVYDRWGEMVFESKDAPLNDKTYGWDGTFKGQPMDPAVFTYIAEVLFDDGQILIYKGDATLLR